MIQDATFIESELGRKRYYKEKKAEKEGKEIKYTERQKQHIDKEGTFSVKHGQVYFGCKNHIKIDVGNTLIRAYQVTTASLHDGEIDLVKSGDGTAYRDKGYNGKPLHAKNVRDKTMKPAARGHPLCDKEIKCNRRISSRRTTIWCYEKSFPRRNNQS